MRGKILIEAMARAAENPQSDSVTLMRGEAREESTTMRRISADQWYATDRDYRREIDGRRYLLALDRATGATVLEPVDVFCTGRRCVGADRPGAYCERHRARR
jgi:hypothetical protein